MNIRTLSAFFLLSSSPLLADGGTKVDLRSVSSQEVWRSQIGVRAIHSASGEAFQLSEKMKENPHRFAQVFEQVVEEARARGIFEGVNYNLQLVRKFLLNKLPMSGQLASLEEISDVFSQLRNFVLGRGGLLSPGEQGYVPFTENQQLLLKLYAAHVGTLWLTLATSTASHLSSVFKVKHQDYDDFEAQVRKFQEQDPREVAQLTLNYLKEVSLIPEGERVVAHPWIWQNIDFFIDRTYLQKIAYESRTDPEQALKTITEFREECPQASEETRTLIRMYESLLILERHNCLSKSDRDLSLTEAVEAAKFLENALNYDPQLPEVYRMFSGINQLRSYYALSQFNREQLKKLWGREKVRRTNELLDQEWRNFEFAERFIQKRFKIDEQHVAQLAEKLVYAAGRIKDNKPTNPTDIFSEAILFYLGSIFSVGTMDESVSAALKPLVVQFAEENLALFQGRDSYDHSSQLSQVTTRFAKLVHFKLDELTPREALQRSLYNVPLSIAHDFYANMMEMIRRVVHLDPLGDSVHKALCCLGRAQDLLTDEQQAAVREVEETRFSVDVPYSRYNPSPYAIFPNVAEVRNEFMDQKFYGLTDPWERM